MDVTLNNTLANINTKLLADYCAIDGRLTQLAFIVKHWAKRRQVRGRLLLCAVWPQHTPTDSCTGPFSGPDLSMLFQRVSVGPGRAGTFAAM